MHRVLTLVASLLLAGPLLAEEPPKAQPAPEDRLVCELEASTGSHIKRRVCMTESQRKARREADQQQMQRMRPEPRPGATSGP
jgi:hypothetical protein